MLTEQDKQWLRELPVGWVRDPGDGSYQVNRVRQDRYAISHFVKEGGVKVAERSNVEEVIDYLNYIRKQEEEETLVPCGCESCLAESKRAEEWVEEQRAKGIRDYPEDAWITADGAPLKVDSEGTLYLPTEESKCECGAKACNSTFHSDWCPLFKEFK